MVKIIAVLLMLSGAYLGFGYLAHTFPSLGHTAFMAGQTAVSYGYLVAGMALGFVLYVGKKVK
jgi:hypothetical protein